MALSTQVVLSIMTEQIEAAAILRLESIGRDLSRHNIRDEVETISAAMLTVALQRLERIDTLGD